MKTDWIFWRWDVQHTEQFSRFWTWSEWGDPGWWIFSANRKLACRQVAWNNATDLQHYIQYSAVRFGSKYRRCKCTRHTERPNDGIKPTTFLMSNDGANHSSTVPPERGHERRKSHFGKHKNNRKTSARLQQHQISWLIIQVKRN